MERRFSKKIKVGDLFIGGDAPVSIQSMCNTDTRDVVSTCAQIDRLADAGCQIVRLAVVDLEAAQAIGEIKKKTKLPLVADIHFDYRLALASVDAGVDKIRINPGNIGDYTRVRQVVAACKERNIPIRIGVNGGSLEPELLKKYGAPCARAMVESALGHIRILNDCDFDDICVSLKASDVRTTVEAYRLLAEKTDYPLHLGVTEAGTAYMGTVKSAVGIGSLLCDGIGDTIRVSLTAAPEEEIHAAKAILSVCGIRHEGVEIVSCPTCGRCRIDLVPIASEVEKRLAKIHTPMKVAVMGCAVNGPGEAREADVGMAGGNREGLLFRKGEIIKKVPMPEIVDELVKLAEEESLEIEKGINCGV